MGGKNREIDREGKTSQFGWAEANKPKGKKGKKRKSLGNTQEDFVGKISAIWDPFLLENSEIFGAGRLILKAWKARRACWTT